MSIGDQVAAYPVVGYRPDKLTLTRFSRSVFADNKNLGRISNQYISDNTITLGSSNLFAGG